MKKSFIERVKREIRVKTRNYLYWVDDDAYAYEDDGNYNQYLLINRIPVDAIGTTAEYDAEVVYKEVIQTTR